jgi:hypothetical protein
MDFVSDGFVDGRRLRCLNIVDDFTKECLAIEVDTSLPGQWVIAVLERRPESRGLPRSVIASEVSHELLCRSLKNILNELYQGNRSRLCHAFGWNAWALNGWPLL